MATGTKELLSKVYDWVQEGKGDRSADITIGNITNGANYLSIWCYDYREGDGIFVESEDDLKNFYGKLRQKKLAYLRQLQNELGVK